MRAGLPGLWTLRPRP